MKWEKVTLGDISTKIGDGLHGTPKYDDAGEFYFINGNNLINGNIVIKEDTKRISHIEYDKIKKELNDRTILVAINGTIGNIGLYRDEAVALGKSACYINVNESYEKNFVRYILTNQDFQIYARDYATGATIKNLGLKAIRNYSFNAPPLPIQRKIASILSAYDDLIENNLKRIKLLEEQAFSTYKILINNEKLKEGTVGDLATIKSGFAFKAVDWASEGFPVIKIKNIDNNDIDLLNCSFIPENIADAAAKFKLNAGNLLIAMTGATVGKIGMMPRSEQSFYLNQRVGLFIPKTENAELFLFCFFNEPSAKQAIENLASGAAQPNISGGQIESIKLFYPQLPTVLEFGRSLKGHFELIWNLKHQNTKLREARDILLPKLMNGQIEVS
jgi:type I restriction enzyme S subunit